VRRAPPADIGVNVKQAQNQDRVVYQGDLGPDTAAGVLAWPSY
jgi:hypothetical protein